MSCIEYIDHLAVARGYDPAVLRLYRHSRAQHFRGECFVAHFGKRYDLPPDRTLYGLFCNLCGHFFRVGRCPCLFLCSRSLSCRCPCRCFRLYAGCLCLRLLIFIHNERDHKRNAHRDRHLDHVLHRLLQAEQDPEDARHSCTFCPEMYEGSIQGSASAADASCDERLEES